MRRRIHNLAKTRRHATRTWRAVTIILVVALASACMAGSDETDPDDVLQRYVQTYNAGDMDELSTLFAQDARMIGHPTSGEPGGLSGADEIMQLQESERAYASAERPWTITAVEVDGNRVTWSDVWIRDDGQAFCGEGHIATVEDGSITSVDWSPAIYRCTCDVADECDFAAARP